MDERLSAGTQPLPYVAVGMVVRYASDTADEPVLWRVSHVGEDRWERTIILLQQVGNASIKVRQPSAVVRARCQLAEPFHPHPDR